MRGLSGRSLVSCGSNSSREKGHTTIQYYEEVEREEEEEEDEKGRSDHETREGWCLGENSRPEDSSLHHRRRDTHGTIDHLTSAFLREAEVTRNDTRRWGYM